MIGNRLRLATIAMASAFSTVATAGPLTVGVTVGRAQSAANANDDAETTLGIYARLRVLRYLSAQVELQQYTADESGERTAQSSARARAIVVLCSGLWVPIVLAGGGVDWATAVSETGSDLVAGAGLEYRASGGLVVGFDLRIGTITGMPFREDGAPCGGCATFAFYPGFANGEFRSTQLYAGFKF